MKIETLALPAVAPVRVNRARLNCLPMHGPLEPARDLMRTLCNKFIMAQEAQEHAPVDLTDLKLPVLDRLLPYDGKNVVMTRDEYYAVLAFASQLVLLQSHSTPPLLGRYTKMEIGLMLSAVFMTEVTYIRFRLW